MKRVYAPDRVLLLLLLGCHFTIVRYITPNCLVIPLCVHNAQLLFGESVVWSTQLHVYTMDNNSRVTLCHEMNG